MFPSFTYSKADMLVNGILPIDRVTEYLEAISIVIKNIPKPSLETFYKVTLPDIYSGSQFLQVVAKNRGYITGRNLPNEAMMAKIILKDYVSGRLLFCNLRPDYDHALHGDVINYLWYADDKKINIDNFDLIKQIPADFDDNYEKIGISVENKKIIQNSNCYDMDDNFFNADENNLEETPSNNNKKITKEVKKIMKFAMKRGEITEEEYENIETYSDVKVLLEKIEKNTPTDCMSKDLVKLKKISF